MARKTKFEDIDIMRMCRGESSKMAQRYGITRQMVNYYKRKYGYVVPRDRCKTRKALSIRLTPEQHAFIKALPDVNGFFDTMINAAMKRVETVREENRKKFQAHLKRGIEGQKEKNKEES